MNHQQHLPDTAPLAPAAVIDRQLAAYNAHDVRAFADMYDLQAEICDLHSGECLARGREEIFALYAARLSIPGLRAEIAGRIEQGNYVIDSERIFTGGTLASRSAVVIYEIGSGLIQRVWLIRSSFPA